MRKQVVFCAGHLLSPSVASGGDVLFCELAARIARSRPEWDVVALAPDFARADLERFFGRVVTFATGPGEGSQGSPAKVMSTWLRRLPFAPRELSALKPDLVHSTGDFFIDVWPVVFARRRAQMKWSGVVHHVNAPPHRRKNEPAVAAVSYALQRASFVALRSADAISLLNTGVRSDLERLRFDPARLHVVGAGIDIERFPLIPAAERTRRVVWVNRLEPTKGIEDLPEIVRAFPDDVVVDVVGRGPDVHVARLRQGLVQAGVDSRCIVHGFLSEQELREVIRRAAVFISCSYEEGWGISIAEALAMGLPCVAYDLPSHGEIFGDEIRRVRVGDKAAFADTVNQVLARGDTDEERAARRRIAARHSLDACARREEEVFAALLS
ncbi:MAG TPA: glycosyltransferase family 4 protein [Candidatus Baltobacteraceae bacterium]|nr:glycosyltransferase family 4 protein [Candidatus Baltobacteraceae bacterium]